MALAIWPRVAPRASAGRGLKPSHPQRHPTMLSVAPRASAGRGLKLDSTWHKNGNRGRPARERGARIETGPYRLDWRGARIETLSQTTACLKPMGRPARERGARIETLSQTTACLKPMGRPARERGARIETLLKQ